MPADHVSYCPVPLSAMLCGELLALSVMVPAVVIAPTGVGAEMAHLSRPHFKPNERQVEAKNLRPDCQ